MLTALKTEIFYLSTGWVQQKNISMTVLSQIKEWNFFLIVKILETIK